MMQLSMREPKKEPMGIASIIMIYFALKPLYLMKSGALQISDIVLLLSMGYVVLKSGGRLEFDQKSFSVIKIFICVLIYQIVVNAIWTYLTGDRSMSRHDLYYIFNFIAFTLCVYIGHIVGVDCLKRAIGWGSLFAVIITAVGLLFFTGTGSRAMGFFNNPNQLGYFAVLMLTVVALCKEQLNRIQLSAIIIISFWATIVSMSKAAILAYFTEAIILILFYQNNRSLKRIVMELIMIAVIGMIIYLLFYSDSSFVLNNKVLFQMRYRIVHMFEENDSNFGYGRGYARVGEMLPHLLWGTGEGAYNRFIARHGSEVHSTFVLLLTCYGLIGLLGYLKIFKDSMGNGQQFIQNIITLLGAFLYTLTHNGIRNTLLWMIMALMLLNTTSDSEVTVK